MHFLETQSCTVNGQIVPFRGFGDSLLGQPIEPFTGYQREEKLDEWKHEETEVEMSQYQPMQLHLLSVIRRLTLND